MKKGKIYGVIRLYGKGIPLGVHQFEVNEFFLVEIVNTVKAAMTECGPAAKNILMLFHLIYSKIMQRFVAIFFRYPNFVDTILY